ncbi:MAG TPA: Yip1 family protein [Gaiellaceae bacterium]
MSAPAAPPISDADALQRAWWLRSAVVLFAPRAVFAALRDTSLEATQARAEPIAAIVGVAGIAAVLSTPVARHVLNDPGTDTIVVPVWAFIGGATYGLVFYWLYGGCLWAAARGMGGLGDYRRARHLLGLAVAPIALSLLTLWPVRILVFRSDLFRTGGDDYGRGDAVFGAINLGFVAWSAILLVIGVRVVHGWSWSRATATVALAALFPALVALASTL